jgi:uncharacterized membrane protein YsdA (DUF1294 family)
MSSVLGVLRLVGVVYLVIINIAGVITCAADKRRARRHQWRIPEKQIFLTAIAGGSVGVLIGMYAFRHKTQHLQFTIGIPVILLCQILIAAWMISRMH